MLTKKELKAQYQREWYRKNKEKQQAYHQEYHQKNKAARNNRTSAWQTVEREACINILGEECANCGSTDDLCVDHIDGDGDEHRARVPNFKHRYIEILADLEAGNNSFNLQTLCRRCNCAKPRKRATIVACHN